jgi:gamma-glutamyltranspeptidase/glutathione hydrolase
LRHCTYVLALFVELLGASSASAQPLRVLAGSGAVAADHPDASRVGAEVLAQGGNAIDAAVATALALGVASPASSGLGGGGFAVVWRAAEKKAYVIDFRETAPAAATATMFIGPDGKLLDGGMRSRVGGLAVAAIAEPIGLHTLSRRFGKLGWVASVAPAARLARNGFVVTQAHADGAARVLSRFAPQPTDPLYALLHVKAGEILKRPDLAATLEELARSPLLLNKGALTAAIINAVHNKGGVLTAADLASYEPIWREPLRGQFRGLTLVAVPPPAGGLTAVEALQILDARPPSTGAAAAHLIAEAFKHAFADRARALGDPAFVTVPLARLVSVEYAREIAARIKDDRVGRPETYGDKPAAPADPPHDHGTSHLCVVDKEGNVVALTSTVNLLFGSGIVVGGVILNNQMDDFAAQPGTPNAFGLVGSLANAIAPRKRPLSSMTPMIVLRDGKPVLCAGASGGPLIVSATVQTIVRVVDDKLDVAAAINAPRLHAQWLPDKVFVEADMPAAIIETLQKRGHVTAPLGEKGVVQAIAIFADHLEAACDPRKGGRPAAPESHR